ncbi:hypothetical protein GJ496_000728 [Pomphorhynchus laevis]|nr:hypothetical protein GJ496_000728 [Pomphorhynchus laevis]
MTSGSTTGSSGSDEEDKCPRLKSFNDSTCDVEKLAIFEDHEFSKFEFQSPFGKRCIQNCVPGSAVPRILEINRWMTKYFYPFYSNTHSEASMCAMQTNRIRESGRDFISTQLKADPAKYVTIFMDGSFSRACRKIVHFLKIIDNCNIQKSKSRIVVFTSSFEKESCLAEWQKCGCVIRSVKHRRDGRINKRELLNLFKYARKEGWDSVICSFPGINPISGLIENVDVVSEIVKSQKGIIFWDFTTITTSSLCELCMVSDDGRIEKDAVYIGMNNSVAGPGACSVLVINLALMKSTIPEEPGGGTVQTVTDKYHEYANEIQFREEGGTPNIVGSVRCALAFLYDSLPERQDAHADQICNLIKTVLAVFANNDNLLLIGDHKELNRILLFSFVVKVNKLQVFLHSSFVCQLLNDMFGIQSLCGLIESQTVDITDNDHDNVQRQKSNRCSTNKWIPFTCARKCCFVGQQYSCKCPDFCNVTNYTQVQLDSNISEEDLSFILKSVEFVANSGWKLLPAYTWSSHLNTYTYNDELGSNKTRIRSLHNLVCYRNELSFSQSSICTSKDESSINKLSAIDNAYALAEQTLEKHKLRHFENEETQVISPSYMYATKEDVIQMLHAI